MQCLTGMNYMNNRHRRVLVANKLFTLSFSVPLVAISNKNKLKALTMISYIVSCSCVGLSTCYMNR